MRSTCTYATTVDGAIVYHGESLEAAIRKWDLRTYTTPHSMPGGISVQCFNTEGNMVRDGWILHVNRFGVVYLNPNLALT